MSTALLPASAFYGTQLQNKIDGYERLADRISYTLGYPLVNLEVHRNQLYEYISISAEMFTKFAGYTQEYLIFDSDLYEQGIGIRLDKLISLTPDLKDAYTTQDLTLSEVDTRTLSTAMTAGLSSVIWTYDISDGDRDPTEFNIRITNTDDKHQRVSKVLVATQFSHNADLLQSGNASFTEYGVLNTAATEIGSLTVETSGASGHIVNIIATPNSDSTAIVVGQDLYQSTTSTITTQQSALRSYDTLLNRTRKVMEVTGFEEGSNQGVNTLFTIEQTLAQQTYFSYAMGNYGFDLISWYTVKEFLETREKLLATRRSFKFDPHNQYLTMYPGPLSGTSRFYGIVSCWLEKPLLHVIKEPWVYQYALALTKIGIANVRGKFGGTSLMGGGSLNYSDLQSQGLQEKSALEEQLYTGSPGMGDADPPVFFVG